MMFFQLELAAMVIVAIALSIRQAWIERRPASPPYDPRFPGIEWFTATMTINSYPVYHREITHTEDSYPISYRKITRTEG